MHPRHLFLWILLFPASLWAQEPFHYQIGEEELSGIHIYSMVQEHSGIVWITTDQGLYRYDSYDFKLHPGGNSSEPALFSLVVDHTDRVFCLNLLGQIFEVGKDSLELYFQIPDSLLSSSLEIKVDNENQLVVTGQKLFRINQDHGAEVLTRHRVAPIVKGGEEDLIFVDPQNFSVQRFRDGKAEPVPMAIDWSWLIRFQVISNAEEVRVLGWENGLQYAFSSSNPDSLHTIQPQFQGDIHINSVDLSEAGETWIGLVQGGMVVIDRAGKSVFGNQRIYDKYVINAQMVDHEGNRWLGTMGRGILLMPNQAVLDYSQHPGLKDGTLIGLAVAAEGSVYVQVKNDGVQVRKIHPDNTVSTIKTSLRGREGGYFEVHGNGRYLVMSGSPGGIWDLKRGKSPDIDMSAVKECIILDNGGVIWVNQLGLFSTGTSENAGWAEEFSRMTGGVVSENGHASLFLGRANCLAFDEKNKRVWAGTNQGLFRFAGGEKKELKIDGQSVVARDILLADSILWVGTEDAGVYGMVDGVVEHHFQVENGLRENEVRWLHRNGDYLYIVSRRNLQRLRLSDFELTAFGPQHGLEGSTIRYFGVAGDDIWLYTLGGLQKFRFADLRENAVPPKLGEVQLSVNGQPVPAMENARFEHDQNKVEFRFSSHSFRHRGSLQYRYRLLGLSDDWQLQKWDNRSVTYNALPPGKFQFELMALNEDLVPSSTFRYAFQIAQPFWLQWWFWLGTTLVLLALLTLIFRLRLGIVRRRLELEKKLKSSELTAIKAQMNPHFVFNVLNSFQDLIYQKDFRRTNIYLGKFAGLLRKTLAFSEQEFITLEEEVSLLNDYLDLEKLRFGDELEVDLKLELGGRSAEALTIPALLLQPFVENALKHGLLHKQGRKTLTLRFWVAGNAMHCEIQDNGVGRAMSEKIQSRRKKYHHPFASEATFKRIELMNQSRKKPIRFAVEDLKNAAGEDAGTKVVISFPIDDENE